MRSQTWRDFRVVIGFDPPAADELHLLDPFSSDERFGFHENRERLGWDGNVRALMRGVDSPLFMVLPHDDLIHPTYLEVLVARISADPDASVAYADLLLFGGDAAPSIKAVELPEDGGRADQVMAFLLQGAEAVPWKGVARSSILSEHEFPVDGYGGFAAECEWALQLLLHGKAPRVPRPMYYKRHAAPRTTTASKRWGGLSLDALMRAWKDHRHRMMRMIEAGIDADRTRRDLHAAAEAALLSRLVQAVRVGRTPSSVLERVTDELGTANANILSHLHQAGDSSPWATRIDSVRLTASALWSAWQGDWEETLRTATEAIDRDAANGEALLLRARALVKSNRHQEALDSALAAVSIAPHGRGVVELMGEISAGLGSSGAPRT